MPAAAPAGPAATPAPGRKLLQLACDRITADTSLQPRAGLDEDVVAEYAEAMLGNPPAEFPAVVAFQEGKTFWLASGFHRLAAHIRAKQKYIVCDVRPGGRRETLLFAVGANRKHGHRLTNADKRRGVLLLLRDREWREWSNRRIGEQCGASESLVRCVRFELEAQAEDRAQAREKAQRKAKRGGTTYTIDTTNLGGKGRVRRLHDCESAADTETLAVKQIADLVADCRRKHLSFREAEARTRADVALDGYLAVLPRVPNGE